MKKILHILLLLLVVQVGKAQYVNIPDAGLRSWLNSHGYTACMSGNNLDTLCSTVLADTTLTFNNPSPQISDFTGLQYFKGLKYLEIDGTLATNLPNLPVSLRTLYLNNATHITSLSNLPANISMLELSGCSQLSSISAFPAGLKTLWIFAPHSLTSVPSFPAGIGDLQITDNFLLHALPPFSDSLNNLALEGLAVTNLPVLPSKVTQVRCVYDTNLVFTAPFPASLQLLVANYCNLTSLPALPNNLQTLNVEYNLLVHLPALPNSLTFVECQSNALVDLPNFPSFVQTFLCDTNPGLTCLPQIPSTVSWLGFYNTGVSCVPNYVTISYSNPVLTSLPLCQPGNVHGCLTLTASAGPNQTICPNNLVGLDGTIVYMHATGTGSWSALPSNPQGMMIWSSNSATTGISGQGNAGLYGFVWGSAPGDTTYVTILPAPAAPVLTELGTCQQRDTLHVQGALAGDSIQWWAVYNGIYATTNWSNSNLILPYVPYGQSYIAVLKGSNGCSSATSDTVYVETCDNDAGPDQNICFNGTATMGASGPGFWEALPTNPGTAIIVNDTLPNTTITSFSNPGTFGFTWGGAEGDTAFVNVTDCGTAGPNQTICRYTTTLSDTVTIQLNATGPGSWLGLPTNAPGLTILNPTVGYSQIKGIAVPGTYGFYWGTVPGDTMYVTVRPVPSRPTLSMAGTCLPNETIYAHGAEGADSIVWGYISNSRYVTTPVSDSTLVPTIASSYTVYTFDANRCTSLVSDTVVIASCTADAGPNQTVCQQVGWVTVQMAATGGGTWSALASNPNAVEINQPNSPTTTITQIYTPGIFGFVWSTGVADTMYVTVEPYVSGLIALIGDCLGHDSLVIKNASAADSIIWIWNNTPVEETVASDSFYIPTAPGTYRYKTISQQGCVYYYYGDSVSVNATDSPTVELGYPGDLPANYCSGSPNTFTAMTTVAGTSPYYQWYKNGITVGSNAPTYVTSVLATNDSVWVVMTSNSACAVPATVKSAAIVVHVNIAPQALLTSSGNCLASNELVLHGVDNYQAISWYYNGNRVLVDSQGLSIAAGGNGVGPGGATNQLANPCGLFIDSAGYLYVADEFNNRVMRFPPNSNSLTNGVIVAGGNGSGTAANQLDFPYSVCVDKAGNLYVNDGNNARIQKFPAGSTSATNGVTIAYIEGLSGSICVDSLGNVYVPDRQYSRIWEYPADGSARFTVAGGTFGSAADQLNNPFDVKLDAAGNMYVADEGNGRIQKFPRGSTQGTSAVTVAGGNGIGYGPNQIAGCSNIYLDSAGQLYVFDYYWSRVLRFPPGSTSATLGTVVAGGWDVSTGINKFFTGEGIEMDRTGNIYISSLLNAGVLKYAPISLDSVYVPSAPGQYTAVISGVYGCTSGFSDTIVINNCNQNDTIHICHGSSYQIENVVTGSNASTYLWAPPAGLSSNAVLNPVATPAITTLYTLIAIDTNGTAYRDTVLIIVDSPCLGFVWPGDADDNGIVDNTDLLPIGLTYGFTGPSRPQQDINWYAHSATAWGGTNSGGINDVYSDCDGNGSVNINDVQAILQNYNQVHGKTGENGSERSGAPVLKMVIMPDTVLNGDTLTCHIILGDSSTPANNVYGLAFTFNFNPIVVDSNSLAMTFPDSWLATQSQHISLAKNDFNNGAIYAGLSRINQVQRSGSGEIASVSMVITTDNIDGKNMSYYTAQFGITGVKMINQLGDTIPVNTPGDSAIIGFFPTSIQNDGIGNVDIKLFPDPANNSAQIRTNGAKLSELILTDVLGRHVQGYYQINTANFTLPTANLNAGVYFAQVTIGNNTVVKKFLVQH